MSEIKNWRKNIRNLFESASPDYFREADDDLPEVTGDLPSPEMDDGMIDNEFGDETVAETITMDKDLFIKLMNHVAGKEDEELEDEELEDTSGEELEDTSGDELEDENLLEDEDLEDDSLEDVDDSLEDDSVEDEEIVDIEDEDEGDVNVEEIANKVVELSAGGETLTLDHFDQIVAPEEGLGDLEDNEEETL